MHFAFTHEKGDPKVALFHAARDLLTEQSSALSRTEGKADELLHAHVAAVQRHFVVGIVQ